MKKISFLLILILPFSLLHSQSWSALDGGITGGGLATALYNGQLYVGGSFITAGSNGDTVNRIAHWDGFNWNVVGAGMNNTVYALAENNGSLYAGGRFTSAGQMNNCNSIAKWNGSSWDSLGHGLTSSGTSYVRAITSYNGNLVAGGSFTMAGSTPVNNIAMWNGTNWIALGTGLTGGIIYSLEVYNGDLYAGGSFSNAGSAIVNGIARWDGTSWNPCGPGFVGSVLALRSYAGRLIAGGTFYYDGNYNYIFSGLSAWDGTSWNFMGSGASDNVSCLAEYGTKLYIGGKFHDLDGTFVNGIASWDGTNYDWLGGGMVFTQAGVVSMVADDGYLFATGTFTTAGGNPAAGVAQWNVLLSIDETDANGYSFRTFPNPSSGIFNFHSDKFSGDEVIETYNSLGEKINSFAIKNENEQIDLSNEAKGIYFCRVISGNKLISELKVVIQ